MRRFSAPLKYCFPILCAIAFGTPAFADDFPACRANWSQVRPVILRQGVRIVELTTAQRINVSAKYNQSEPVTDYVFDHIYVLTKAGLTDVVVVFVSGNDCVQFAPVVPAALLAAALVPPPSI
jgi:hypothetical protein